MADAVLLQRTCTHCCQRCPLGLQVCLPLLQLLLQTGTLRLQ
jgi:hypothetical protein